MLKKIYKIILIVVIFLYYLWNLSNNRKIVSQPKISVFLPIYNKATYLKRSIGSIQNQTIKDIEIIPVNDGSKDNTLEILNELARNDSRIKIINNAKNRGLLYSRAMGILSSEGEFLMNLDPDDEFKGTDALDFLYKIAKKSKTDVVSFGHLIKDSFNSKESFGCTKFWRVQKQPKILELGNKMLDYLITDKLIKREIFMKAYDILRPEVYGEKWNYAEDEVWSALINMYANSKICTNKIVYIYHYNNDSLMHNRINNIFLSNLINWFKMFHKIYDKKEYEIYLLNRINILIEIFDIFSENITNIILKNTSLKKNIFHFLNILIIIIIILLILLI